MSSADSNSNPQNPANASSLLFGTSGSEALDPTVNWRECFPEIIGRSRVLQHVLEGVSKVARSDSAVLIFGESGTGKELIASALHRLSTRSNKRFVPINCSAIPENLLESELFGHEKGAFTGAVNRRPGHFEVADGGTLFLDEIGDMPQRLQAKLLRVLQEKQYTSVGGQHLKNVDVRIIAATNIDLNEAVRDGRFRLDLFYRLNVLPVTLPPLRERREDIIDLLDHYLAVANRVHGVQNHCFYSTEVIEFLTAYSWPGNVRELQNLVERLVVMRHGGEILLNHLPSEYREPSGNPANLHSQRRTPHDHLVPTQFAMPLAAAPRRDEVQVPQTFGSLPNEGLNLANYIEQLENSLIQQALERTSNNKNQAAKLLGLNRTTLVERIKKRKIVVDGDVD